MTRQNLTEIVFVLDRSGSMSSIAADMRGGFDAFIQKQREVAGECNVTLVQFDDRYDVVYKGRPLHEVKALELVPRGSTALLDAVARAIAETGERLSALRECDRPERVLFVVITDGDENASREYKGDEGRRRVFDMITHQREKYNWEFVFMGANQDSIKAATSIGISARNAVTYSANSSGTKGIMCGLSDRVASYRSGDINAGDTLFGQADYEQAVRSITKGS